MTGEIYVNQQWDSNMDLLWTVAQYQMITIFNIRLFILQTTSFLLTYQEIQ